MIQKKIIFRTDASLSIGTGHVRRCLVVADNFRKQGIGSIFLCRDIEGELSDFIKNEGFEVHLLKGFSDPPKDKICFEQRKDALECLHYIKEAKAIFIDHYGLDKEFETIIKTHTQAKVIVLDDLLGRHHNCDIFIDYMPYERNHDFYVNTEAKKLLGLDYVILRDEFLQAKDLSKKKIPKNEPKNILIFLGGNDPDNITSFLLNVLEKQKYHSLYIKTVVGGNCPHIQQLKELSDNYEHIELIVQAPNMAELLLWSDMAIGSGGTNTWERLLLNVPSLVIELADNQKEICAYLEKNNYAKFIGQAHKLSPKDFEENFDCFLADYSENSQILLEQTIFPHFETQTLLQEICADIS